MAGNQPELDANEPATQHKLDKAKERGSVARSTEVVFALVLLVCVASLYGLGSQVVQGIALVARRGLSFVSRDELTQAAALSYVQSLTSAAVLVLAPVMLPRDGFVARREKSRMAT